MRPEPGPFACFRQGDPLGRVGYVVREELRCSGCGRSGAAADVVTGWSVSRPPRPTGSTAPRTAEQERLTMLCPDCARRRVRDLEARLD